MHSERGGKEGKGEDSLSIAASEEKPLKKWINDGDQKNQRNMDDYRRRPAVGGNSRQWRRCLSGGGGGGGCGGASHPCPFLIVPLSSQSPPQSSLLLHTPPQSRVTLLLQPSSPHLPYLLLVRVKKD